MRGQASRRSRHLRVIAAGVVVALGGVGILAVHAVAAEPSGAAVAAAPARVLAPAAKVKPTVPVEIPTSGPGVLPFASNGPGRAVALSNGETLAGKLLSVVKLPPLDLLIYPNAVNHIDDPTYGGRTASDSYAWIISDPTPSGGTKPASISYGSIPAVTVTTLAFGVIPVTATLRINQTVGSDGLVTPLIATQLQPSGVLGDPTNLTGFTVSGLLDVGVDSVVVDGRPLTLTGRCATVTPARLLARNYGGFTGPPNYNPFAGGLLSGTITIPGFTGCTVSDGTRTDNLNDLFDGTVSGRTNATFLSQAGVGTYDPTYENDCRTGDPQFLGGCGAPPTLAPITGPTPVTTYPSGFPFAAPSYDPSQYN